MFRKIMVPVDLDAPELAAKAMAIAKQLAAAADAEILAITVVPDPRDAAAEARLAARLQAYIDAEKGAFRMDGVLTLGGSIADEVRAAAAEMGVDLVVMGSHEPRLEDHLLGSKSSRVALHSQCSVLVVR